MTTYKLAWLIVLVSMLVEPRGDAPAQQAGKDPGPAGGSAVAVPAGPASARPLKTQQCVLLTDGRLVRGEVTEEDSMLIVTQPIGTMKFPRRRVERIFATTEEVYQYKLEQLPENDFDERIKLARWCLGEKMEPQARKQLEAILEQSPKHTQAKAMMAALDQAQVRMTARQRDPSVQQTAARGVDQGADERPGSLDASVISSAQRGMGIPDVPVIFDLPPAQAVRRAEEFARFVHPVLQSYCARCHNENYEGSFQLVQFKTKIDRTPAALRANLDATLRLIDQENPAHSDLLSSSLRPHGRGPKPRPVFQGSNDHAYQILATWANKLRSSQRSEGVIPARLPRTDQDAGESFASDRSRITANQGEVTTPPRGFVTGPVETRSLPPVRFDPARGKMVPETPADARSFPLPFAVSNTRPDTIPTPRAAVPPVPPADQPEVRKPAAPPEAPPPPRSGAASSQPVTPSKDTSGAAENPAPEPSAPAGTAEAKKKPRKPLSLDPTLLQRALQLRNQNR